GLDRDSSEAFLFNEPFSNLRALRVELMRAVRRLTNQDESGIINQPHQRIIISARTRQRMSGFAYGIAQAEAGCVSHRCYLSDEPTRAVRYLSFDAALACPLVDNSSRWRTSSSVVCEKSLYQRPTASNGSGVIAQTISSTSILYSSHVCTAET